MHKKIFIILKMYRVFLFPGNKVFYSMKKKTLPGKTSFTTSHPDRASCHVFMMYPHSICEHPYELLIALILCLRSCRCYSAITLIHPSGASMCPIWMPVSVSYNFWMTGPMASIPLGKQISFPWSTDLADRGDHCGCTAKTTFRKIFYFVK